MKLSWKLLLFAIFFLVFRHGLSAQYILNGSAQKNSCNCYTLTQPITTQSGSVWNSNKINLTNSFDFWFNVFLGCSDAGADGIVFILQPISTSVGTTGEGMGFGGVSPSIGIALDTYQNPNLNDPAFDHISIQSNGIVNHASDLAGPVPISSTSDNVEDCQWHRLRITWDAGTKWLRTYFDGVLRLERQVDLTGTIFNNDPAVYWGFTGATGGQVNLQQFCTALDPIFTSNFTNSTGCEGQPIVFTNASESFAPITSYHWNFGDGTTSTLQNPPPHIYNTPGEYKVTLKITGQDGCEKDSVRTIRIAAKPEATLRVFDTCVGAAPRIEVAGSTADVSYQWTLNGAAVAGDRNPALPVLTPGNYRLQVSVSSNFGCGSPAVATADFVIKPRPEIEAILDGGCVNETLHFTAQQTDVQTTIPQWTWLIDSKPFSEKDVHYVFREAGEYEILLSAVATNGCTSEVITKKINLAEAAIRTNDTTIIRNRSAQLQIQANGSVVWSPSIGLSDATTTNPIVTLSSDQKYTITVTTPEGCTTSGTVLVKVFNGPMVYVPTAFTPNGDGKNDWLLPVYVGIKELKQFGVFDRWGQRVFHTHNMQLGWSGKVASGTYVWLVEAIDDRGQRLLLKGTVTLIR